MKYDVSNTELGSIDITKSRGLHDWYVSIIWFVFLTAYIAVFWARLGELLPPPYDRWTFIYELLIAPWWINNFFIDRPEYVRLDILWKIVCFISSLALPIVFFLIKGRELTDFGLGMLNRLGIRLATIAIIVSIPFGLWIQLSSPLPHRLTLTYILGLLNKIPEHFLIIGILTAMMLPHRRLPDPPYVAPIEGSSGHRFLRWLGLAQPATVDSDNRVLAWFGLNWTSLFAIVASGLAFFMIHLGRDNHIEVALSLPGGILVSYITIRTHSIWHAIPAHWTLNLVPMGILYLWDKY